MASMQQYNDKGHASHLSDGDLRKLLDDCRKAKEKAYAPYSQFRVGCALITESGEFYHGCNVENASYGLSICAERTALVKAVSEGHLRFKAIAVTTDLDYFVYPCGACRQFISEFGDMEVFVSTNNGDWRLVSVDQLLPYAFKPKDLADFDLNRGKLKS